MLLTSRILFYLLYCTHPPSALHDHITPLPLSSITHSFSSFPLLPVIFLPISLRKKKQASNQRRTSTNSHATSAVCPASVPVISTFPPLRWMSPPRSLRRPATVLCNEDTIPSIQGKHSCNSSVSLLQCQTSPLLS